MSFKFKNKYPRLSWIIPTCIAILILLLLLLFLFKPDIFVPKPKLPITEEVSETQPVVAEEPSSLTKLNKILDNYQNSLNEISTEVKTISSERDELEKEIKSSQSQSFKSEEEKKADKEFEEKLEKSSKYFFDRVQQIKNEEKLLNNINEKSSLNNVKKELENLKEIIKQKDYKYVHNSLDIKSKGLISRIDIVLNNQFISEYDIDFVKNKITVFKKELDNLNDEYNQILMKKFDNKSKLPESFGNASEESILDNVMDKGKSLLHDLGNTFKFDFNSHALAVPGILSSHV